MTSSSSQRVPVYPFAAIVGQHEMKRALILVAIDPGIGRAGCQTQHGQHQQASAHRLTPPRPQRIARINAGSLGGQRSDLLLPE